MKRIDGPRARLISETKDINYRLACVKFLKLVQRALKDLDISPLAQGVLGRRKSLYRLAAILDLNDTEHHKGDKTTFFNFLRGKVAITPENPLYFHLCDQLGIDPGEAGFDYELIKE